ncbi:hypothetical protein ACEUZ9_004030 [Paracoccus litorisediminis]|uniref:hypothetical protein n=1 Tax=Paracoccus litorisediminis TaxID=2006130 RepID=UPI003730BC3F
MRPLYLLVPAYLSLSLCTAMAQSMPVSEAAAVTAALDAGDAAALISTLQGKAIHLTPEQNLKANQLLLTHLATLPQDDVAERRSIAELLTAMVQAQAVGTDVATVPAPPEKQLPADVAKALEARDGATLVRLVLKKDFRAGDLGKGKTEVIAAISEYAKPLPASNAKANKEAYQALAILEPENTTFKQKAEKYALAEREAKSGALKKLKKRVDEFNGTTFYTHPAKPRYADTRSYLIPYLATKGGTTILRIELHYTSDSWLFAHSAKLNIDGKMIPFYAPGSDWKRDNDSEIWEWLDVAATPELRSLLELVAASKKTIIRIDGQQYYDDFSVSEKDKAAIRDVLAAEQSLKEAELTAQHSEERGRSRRLP